MKPPEADLHLHTNYSDGADTPAELVAQAEKLGLACIAVTDHDTLDGVRPALARGRELGVEVLAGIELSASIHGRDIHLLGYCYDLDHPELNAYLLRVQKMRVERMARIIKKLAGLGVAGITLEEVLERATATASIGRPHLATVMYERGLVRNVQEAFSQYLADDAPAFVADFKQDPYETIALIRRAGGVPVMAHPMVTKMDELIPGLVEAGLMGIEAWYPNNSRNIIDFYVGLAKKHNLLVTGGSDGHGGRKKATFIGKMRVPYEYVEILKSAAAAV
jgi:predicted metal-dependent phosphoesterase TrpH